MKYINKQLNIITENLFIFSNEIDEIHKYYI